MSLPEHCPSCGSCGFPMREPADFAGGRPGAAYCSTCGDDTGRLRPYDEVLQAATKVPNDAPEFKAAQINHAHALLLNGQIGNAREVYAANMTLRGADEFRRILREDFAELRRSGRDHPGMARIEKLFAVGANPQ